MLYKVKGRHNHSFWITQTPNALQYFHTVGRALYSVSNKSPSDWSTVGYYQLLSFCLNSVLQNFEHRTCSFQPSAFSIEYSCFTTLWPGTKYSTAVAVSKYCRTFRFRFLCFHSHISLIAFIITWLSLINSFRLKNYVYRSETVSCLFESFRVICLPAKHDSSFFLIHLLSLV